MVHGEKRIITAAVIKLNIKRRLEQKCNLTGSLESKMTAGGKKLKFEAKLMPEGTKK